MHTSVNKFKSTANAVAAMVGVQFFVFAIVGIVAIYGDIMFLQIMWSTYPEGLFKFFALLGAFTTAFSLMALLLGKKLWFRPGGQLLWAYGFTALEFIVIALNILLAFQLGHNGIRHLDGLMATWYGFCPISPVISAAGWILIMMLDSALRQRHEDMEMEDQMNAAERAHTLAAHTARMQLRGSMLEQHTAYLAEEVNNPAMQAGIREAARRLARQELTGLAGFPVAPGLQPPTVEGSIEPPKVSDAQSTNNASPLDQPTLDPSKASQGATNGNH